MPNWVYNVIICKKDLLGKICGGEGGVDFSVLIPEPRTKNELLDLYGDAYLDEKDEDGWSRHSLDHSDGREWFNWYDWHCDFWGTKWNACESNIEERDNGLVYVYFDTAWAPPMRWVEKLASLGQPFILHWTEEQGFGECKGFNGKIDVSGSWGYFEYDEETGDWIDDDSRDLPDTEIVEQFFGI